MRILVAALVSGLLLPACGAQTTDPVPDLASSDNEGVRAELDTMVVPKGAVGGLPRGLRLGSDSGWVDNRAEAEGSFDPDDSASSLDEAGRITGYELVYYDPMLAALRAGRGVDGFRTWVELFSSATAASAYLHDRVAHVRSLAGSSPRVGISFEAVTPFDVHMSADEAFGLRESTVFGDDRLFRTRISFRRGRIVASAIVVHADNESGSADVERVAGILDARIQHALRGRISEEPVLIPTDGVPLDGQQPTADRPPGAPDLAAIVLQPADVPAEFRCGPGRYTHTTPPRITFQRYFCPRGAAVAGTKLSGLTSEVSVFESELAARTSLSLTVQSLLSPEGLEGFAANFAASTGLVPTNVRSSRLELEGGGVGLLTTFDTDVGPMVDFYAVAQSGRGLATIDAIGRAKGFDHSDTLPLLETVVRRLDSLG